MKSKTIGIWFGAALLGFSSLSAQAVVSLWDYGFNIDTTLTLYGDPNPAELTGGVFDYTTGYGSLEFTITGEGDHSIDAWFDHEISESTNTFFNGYGEVSGTADVLQSWEIDDPFFGDIYSHFQDSLLSSTNDVPVTSPNDVSMAMGWDFTLAVGEEALIEFLLSDVAPVDGFYLTQIDPDSNESIYFSSVLTITDGGTSVPEPGAILLMGLGLVGIGVSRRKKRGA